MRRAVEPRSDVAAERLLLIDPRRGTFGDARVRDLPEQLRAGDLLVVNDSATLPASLGAITEAGAAIELRLVRRTPDGAWSAVLFGAGDWREATEHRAAPPPLAAGARVRLSADLAARVERVSALSARLVDLRFDAPEERLLPLLYRLGRPVQYSYLRRALDLWDVQTRYASRPWSVELPSAGRPLSWSLLQRIAARGVRIRALTHSAGLSSTGDPALDAALPFPEHYEIPRATAEAIAQARDGGGRVVAVGTTVVRALEGCAARHGRVVAGAGETDLLIGPGFRTRVADGLFTGMHEPAASHFRLLQALAPAELIERAYAWADGAGYLGHEFGDSNLILG